MGQVHRFLGLSVGLIQQDMRPEERRRNYACTLPMHHSELGFDYLRDNMANDMAEVVQRNFQFCVIDEVDSILIDEALPFDCQVKIQKRRKGSQAESLVRQ